MINLHSFYSHTTSAKGRQIHSLYYSYLFKIHKIYNKALYTYWTIKDLCCVFNVKPYKIFHITHCHCTFIASMLYIAI